MHCNLLEWTVLLLVLYVSVYMFILYISIYINTNILIVWCKTMIFPSLMTWGCIFALKKEIQRNLYNTIGKITLKLLTFSCLPGWVFTKSYLLYPHETRLWGYNGLTLSVSSIPVDGIVPGAYFQFWFGISISNFICKFPLPLSEIWFIWGLKIFLCVCYRFFIQLNGWHGFQSIIMRWSDINWWPILIDQPKFWSLRKVS